MSRLSFASWRRALLPVAATAALGGCGATSPTLSPAPAAPGATPVPGTLSTTGSETTSIGDLYTSNWRSDDFAGTALRRWTPAGDAFYFKWSTRAGDQNGRIGRTWPSAALGVRVDDVRIPCLMSTGAEPIDVSSAGYHIWSIYGWTHAANVGWQSPNGWNNEFYVTFHSWNGSLRAPFTAASGYVPIGGVTIDGVDFDGYVNDMAWGTPNQTQWVIEARNPVWTASVDLQKVFAFWRSKGLPNEYVVDLTWAVEAGAAGGAATGEIQLTNVVVPNLR